MASTIIADYLEGDEALELKVLLEAADVPAIVKRHGLPWFFGINGNFRVIIDRETRENARIIAENFFAVLKSRRTETVRLLTTLCPVCSCAAIKKVEKNSLLQKIRFKGVRIWRCDACTSTWYT